MRTVYDGEGSHWVVDMGLGHTAILRWMRLGVEIGTSEGREKVNTRARMNMYHGRRKGTIAKRTSAIRRIKRTCQYLKHHIMLHLPMIEMRRTHNLRVGIRMI